MDRTKIQWCHSTKNPVMGCDGCELWPGAGQVVTAVANRLQNELGISARAILRKAIGGHALSQIYTRRESLGKSVAKALGDARVTQVVVDGVRNQAKCYAGRVAPVRLRDGFVARRLGSATTKRSGDSNEIEPVILVGY
jgi:hypothetical protein